ncbi:MAG TPA: hypothetical protein VMG55_01285 [Stellaceae bacterium]|nr:hypothetical protein [Stellaceae bacterium]
MSLSVQRIREHLSQDWLLLAAPAVAVGALVWTLTLSSTTESKLAEVVQRVDGLDLRIARIAAAMPDLRERVAYEAVFSPFTVAVLTLPAETNDAGGVSETIFVVEVSTGAVQQYRLRWKPENPGMAFAVAGALRTLDPRAFSVAEAERLAGTIGEPAARLPALDREQSFVLYRPLTAVSDALLKMGATKERAFSSSPVLNWAQFARVLETSTWLAPPKADPHAID